MMNDFKKWKEVTKGIYRYVVSAGACYEIHILYHDKGTDILTAKASLFITGDWSTKEQGSFFERECLLNEQPVLECLNAAIKDEEGVSYETI